MSSILSLKNYFALFVAVSALIMLTDLGLMFIVELFVIAVFIYNFKGIHISKEDILLLLFLVYVLSTFLFSSYPLAVFVYNIRAVLIPVLGYFIAKTRNSLKNELYKGEYIPIYVSVIVGLALFILNPPFYWDFKCRTSSYADLDNLGECTDYFELTRFSSFWAHSYCISTLSLFLSLLMLTQMIKRKTISFANIVGFFLLLFVLLIAQQRVHIAFYFLSLFICSVYTFFKERESLGSIGKLLGLYLLSLFLIFALVYVVLGQEFIDYVFDRTFGYKGDDGIVSDRFATFSEFVSEISLFGSGFGKFSHGALYVASMPAITDCDYLKLPCEIGIFGTIVFLVIIGKGLLYGFCNFNELKYESLILLFYPIAMVGASPFASQYYLPVMFWYCLGSVTYKMELLRCKNKSQLS